MFWPCEYMSQIAYSWLNNVRYVDSLPIQTRSWDVEWILSWWLIDILFAIDSFI